MRVVGRSRSGPFALLIIATLVVAACGGGAAAPATSAAPAAPATSAASSAAPASTAPIKVALVGPLTGAFAVSTTGFKNSAEVAAEQINAKGGVKGRKIEFTFKDDQGQPNLTSQYVQELNEQKTNIFITVTGASVLALQPLMANGKIITFTANPPEVQNDPKQLPFNFNFFPPNRFATDAMGSYAVRKGQKSWALLSDASGQFQEYIKFITAAAGTLGAKIVLDQNFDAATTDFSSIAKKIKDSGADAVMFFASGPPIARYLQAVKAVDFKGNVYAGYGGTAGDLTTAPQDVLEKQYYFSSNVTTLLGTDGKPAVKEYGDIAKLHWDKYGKKAGVGGGVTYDVFAGILWAIDQAGGDDPVKMRTALEKTAASGGVGFSASSVKYKFSAESHGGFPPDQVKLAKTSASPDYPGFYPAAP